MPKDPKAAGSKSKGKKVAPAPDFGQEEENVKSAINPIFETKKKNFGIGQDIQPKRDLTRFVRWPKYVRIQRQRAILKKRLRVPPMINQFLNTLDKNTATSLFRFLNKYRPETKIEKRDRLRGIAQAKTEGKEVPAGKKPIFVKHGINHITSLVESKKAQLVIIAHDVDPIEIVVWLPTLCRKLDIPYCIVKSKARLGAVVHRKTATALAVTGIRPEDKHELAQLLQAVKANFNDKYDETRKTWGGGILSKHSQARFAEIEKARAVALAARKG